MADYELQIARYDSGSPFNTRAEAKNYLNMFPKHRYGQFIAVKYLDGSTWPDGEDVVNIILAMGVKDWDGAPTGEPPYGPDYYTIVSDSGGSGGGGSSAGRVYKMDKYYTSKEESIGSGIPIERSFFEEENMSEYITDSIYVIEKDKGADLYEPADGDMVIIETVDGLYRIFVYSDSDNMWHQSNKNDTLHLEVSKTTDASDEPIVVAECDYNGESPQSLDINTDDYAKWNEITL